MLFIRKYFLQDESKARCKNIEIIGFHGILIVIVEQFFQPNNSIHRIFLS